jgi:ribokinase
MSQRYWWWQQHGCAMLLPPHIAPTGAGDCFTAAWMVGILESQSPAQAMRFAAAAASICVSRPGAMTSLPTRQELDRFLQSLQ